MSGQWRWRGVLTSANAQPALAFYAWDEPEGAYLPFALNVLSLRDGGLVSDVTAFIVRAADDPDPDDYRELPAPADGRAPARRHVQPLRAARPAELADRSDWRPRSAAASVPNRVP